ncbi:hypothetical protein PR048_032819, partial [Dryococelus australis]
MQPGGERNTGRGRREWLRLHFVFGILVESTLPRGELSIRVYQPTRHRLSVQAFRALYAGVKETRFAMRVCVCVSTGNRRRSLKQLFGVRPSDWAIASRTELIQTCAAETYRFALGNAAFQSSVAGASVAERLDCSPPPHVEPGSFRRRVTPGFSYLGFLGDLLFPPTLCSPAALYSPHFTLISSQYLYVKSRPKTLYSTHPSICSDVSSVK